MPIRFYIIRDRKTLKLDVLRVEGDTSRMPVYVCPPASEEPKDEIPSKLKERLDLSSSILSIILRIFLLSLLAIFLRSSISFVSSRGLESECKRISLARARFFSITASPVISAQRREFSLASRII